MVDFLLLAVPAGIAVAAAAAKPKRPEDHPTEDKVIQKAAPEKIGTCTKLEKPKDLLEVEAAMRKLSEDHYAAYQGLMLRQKMKEITYEAMSKLLQENTAKLRAGHALLRARHDVAHENWLRIRAEYRAKGCTVYDVRLPPRKNKPSVIVTYCCPPGELPVQWQAVIEQLEKEKVCTRRSLPPEVRRELVKRGWRSVQPPMPTTQVGYARAMVMPMAYLCPPGVSIKAPTTIKPGPIWPVLQSVIATHR